MPRYFEFEVSLIGIISVWANPAGNAFKDA